MLEVCRRLLSPGSWRTSSGESRPAYTVRRAIRPEREWLRSVRERLVVELSNLHGEWQDDGELVRGPGTLAVHATATHEAEPGHVDIAFLLNRDRPDAPGLLEPGWQVLGKIDDFEIPRL